MLTVSEHQILMGSVIAYDLSDAQAREECGSGHHEPPGLHACCVSQRRVLARKALATQMGWTGRYLGDTSPQLAPAASSLDSRRVDQTMLLICLVAREAVTMRRPAVPLHPLLVSLLPTDHLGTLPRCEVHA